VVPQQQLCTAISAIPTANVQQLSNQLSQSAVWTFQWTTPVPLPLGFTAQCVVIKRDNMATHESRQFPIHKNGSAITTTLLSKFLAITPTQAAQRSYFSACWVQTEDSHGPWIFPGMRLDPSSGVLSDWWCLASDRHQFPLAAATIRHTHTGQNSRCPVSSGSPSSLFVHLFETECLQIMGSFSAAAYPSIHPTSSVKALKRTQSSVPSLSCCNQIHKR